MISFDKRLLQRIRIPLGFIFAVVFLVFAQPTMLTLGIGALIAAIGLAIRAWASGHIRKAKILARTGPYAYTRNPLYFGTLILGLGFTAASGVWWLALLFFAMFLGIYWPVMRVEADDMLNIFGDEFVRYRDEVPLFFPGSGVRNETNERFNFQLYLQYREYRAAIGAASALAVLMLKAVFLR